MIALSPQPDHRSGEADGLAMYLHGFNRAVHNVLAAPRRPDQITFFFHYLSYEIDLYVTDIIFSPCIAHKTPAQHQISCLTVYLSHLRLVISIDNIS
jgi:hypothetical protein